MSDDLESLCAEIRTWHRQRVYAMEQRKRADLALGSFMRLMLGWSRDLPSDEAKAIRDRVQALLSLGDKIAREEAKPAEKQRWVAGSMDGDFLIWRDVIMASIAARTPFDMIENNALKHMKALARTLPVWAEFGAGVRGFGEASLAVIVAEAGNLSAYPKKGHLWKRFGLAVIDGTRQGGLPKSARADEWIEHGISRRRRACMWVIGDAMIRAVGGPYRTVYLDRKAFERGKAEAAGLTVAPSASIPKASAAEFMSDGHVHNRAQRYMEKRLLRDLWQAWNRQLPVNRTVPVEARSPLLVDDDAAAEIGASTFSPQGQPLVAPPPPRKERRKATPPVPVEASRVLPTDA